MKTVLNIVKIEIEENGFWSKIENTRTIKILKSMNQSLKYVLKTVLDIVKIEIEENGFWSKIENTRTNKILKSIILPQDFNVKNIVQYLIYPIDIW